MLTIQDSKVIPKLLVFYIVILAIEVYYGELCLLAVIYILSFSLKRGPNDDHSWKEDNEDL